MSIIPAFASLTLPSATANVVPLQELQLPSLQFPTLAVPSQPSKKAAPAPTSNRVTSPASAPVARTLPSTQSTTPAPVAVVDNTYRLVPAPKQAPDPAADPFAKVPVVTELAAPTGVLPEPAAIAPPSTDARQPATPAAPTYEPEAPAVTPPAEEAPPVRMLASAAAAEEETPSTPSAEEPAAPAEPETSSSDPAETSPEPEITSSSDTSIAATTSTTIDSSSSEPSAATTSAAISTTGGPQLVVNVVSVDFGSVEPMTTSTVLVEIENVGDAELTITAVTVSGPEGVYTVATEAPLTLAPGAKATIAVAMTPTGAGPVAGTLTFASNDPDGDVVVPVTGEGSGSEITSGGARAPPSLSERRRARRELDDAQSHDISISANGSDLVLSVNGSATTWTRVEREEHQHHRCRRPGRHPHPGLPRRRDRRVDRLRRRRTTGTTRWSIIGGARVGASTDGPSSGVITVDGTTITYTGLEPTPMSGSGSVVVDGQRPARGDHGDRRHERRRSAATFCSDPDDGDRTVIALRAEHADDRRRRRPRQAHDHRPDRSRQRPTSR